MHKIISDIRERAFALNRQIALVDGEDERVLKAASYIAKNSEIRLKLIGDKKKIDEYVNSLELDFSYEVVNPKKSEYLDGFVNIYQEKRRQKGKNIIDKKSLFDNMMDPSYFAAMMLERGFIDGVVGGAAYPTANVLKAALDIVGLAPHSNVVSGSFAMLLTESLPGNQDVLIFSDCAVIPDPNASQLVDIAINAARVAETVVNVNPVISFLSFSTKGSAKHAQVTKVVEAMEQLKLKFPSYKIDGEFQADAAIIPEIASRKAPDSVIGGRSNVLIFPDLNAGNIAYKLVERIGKAKALGVILEGFAKPVNDLSRGCSVEDVIDMISITALQSNK